MRSMALLTLLVAGCGNPVADAERQFTIVEKSGDSDATCRQAQRVADAHLAQNDAAGYRKWALTARIRCTEADLNQRTQAL